MKYALWWFAASGLAACAFDPLPPEPAGPTGGAWLEPWTHRKAITLLASEIEAPSDGDLVDFPVLVSLRDPELAATALGDDIVFTSGDGETRLASEVELFTQATGELAAWVKVPRLSATADTTVFVYYGNAAPPAQTPEAVWSADHLAVWHLDQDPGPGGTGDIRDATSGNHDGTPASQLLTENSVAAQIGRGIRFAYHFVDFGTLDTGDKFTISMWVRYEGGFDTKTLLANSESGRDADGYRMYVNAINTTDRRLVFETGNGTSGSGRVAETASGVIPRGDFAHVAAVVDRAAGSARLVVNGVDVTTAPTLATSFKTASDLQIARMEDTYLHFLGLMDQVEVATTLRSIEWLRTAYRNQVQPDSFHQLGAEELAP
jgi:MSHA biogenesis protein MshQ